MRYTNEPSQRMTRSPTCATTKLDSFRMMSPWPGVDLGQPSVLSLACEQVDFPWIAIRKPVAEADEPLFVDLPNDVAFHEVADTDATDGDSLLGLATSLQWNVVPVFGYRWRDVIDETTGSPLAHPFDAYVETMNHASSALGLGEITKDELKRSVPIRPRTRSDLGAGRDPLHVAQSVHIAEIARRVWVLQLILKALAGRIEVTDTATTPEFPAIPDRLNPTWLELMSGPPLGRFSPALLFGGGPRLSEATSLEVAALQIYNAVVKEFGFKTCARCGRTFSRQRGRAKYTEDESHRRSDAMYCSKECAQRAASESYRQRKKAGRLQQAGTGERIDPKERKSNDKER